MRAVITNSYGGPEIFTVKDIDKPKPKANEILIRIHASSVSKADTMMRTGKPYIGRLMLGISKPKNKVWGTGFAGVVEAMGSDVRNFNIGDKVFGESLDNFGTYAEYLTLRADSIVAKLPENLSFEEAATMGDGAITSLNFLYKVGKVQAGQEVLINGASGSLGTAAVQIAKYFGARVTAVCSTKNIELVKSLGADEVIDYTQEDFTKRENTFDLIYDTVGVRSFKESCAALKDNGIYASPVLGFPLLGEMILSGIFSQKKAKFSATGALPEKETKQLFKMLLEIINEGKLKAVIDRAYSLEEIRDAHRYIDKGHKRGNVVLLPIAC